MIYNSKNKQLARSLRSNMTETEQIFWSRVRRKQVNGFQFYRQRPILEYIVDFYCPKAKLIVEIDGGGHYNDDAKLQDAKRTERLEHLGFKIIRFSNTEIHTNIDGVLEHLLSFLR